MHDEDLEVTPISWLRYSGIGVLPPYGVPAILSCNSEDIRFVMAVVSGAITSHHVFGLFSLLHSVGTVPTFFRLESA